jgi:hypothetical protein
MAADPVLSVVDGSADAAAVPAEVKEPRVEALVLSTYEKLWDLLHNEALYMLDDLINHLEPKGSGRDRDFPIWPAQVFASAKWLYGSDRQVEAEFRSGELGRLCRAVVREVRPDRPDLWMVSNKQFTRHSYHHRRRALKRNRANLDRLFQEDAAAVCKEIGLCQGTTKGSTWTTPAEAETWQGDGVVITAFKSVYGEAKTLEALNLNTPKAKKTKQELKNYEKALKNIESAKKIDPSIKLYVEGGGKRVLGTKAVINATRHENPNERVITGVGLEALTGHMGDEAALAIELFAATRSLYPTVRAFVYDGAFKGVHCRHVLWLGTLPVVRKTKDKVIKLGFPYPHAINVTCSDGVKRTINHLDTETGEVTEPMVRTKDGHPHIVTTLVDGSELLVPCIKVATKPVRDVFYNHYLMPEGSGIDANLVGAKFMLRLNHGADDDLIGYNRCYHLRAITVHDANYKDVYGRRQDTESGHAKLKAHLPNRRANVRGAEHLHLALLGWQVLQNSIALQLHRRRLEAENASPLAA